MLRRRMRPWSLRWCNVHPVHRVHRGLHWCSAGAEIEAVSSLELLLPQLFAEHIVQTNALSRQCGARWKQSCARGTTVLNMLR